MMWMMVLFDLPVTEPEQRKEASDFRHFLLDLGFEMAQFSVYLRFCSGKEQTQTLLKRIKAKLPEAGKVDVLFFTDKQYENIVSFSGKKSLPERKNPDQYALF